MVYVINFAKILLESTVISVHLIYTSVLLQFTEYGVEGVVPLDLLPSEVRSKYQAKPADRSKRAKKEETKSSTNQAEENQVP